MMIITKKILNRLKESVYELEHNIINWDILKNNKKYVKFIIICDIRSGSTMLTSYLSSHPKILMFYELFHRYQDSIPFNAPGYRGKSSNKEIVNLRNSDPVKFLNDIIFTIHPKRIMAVGFKLHYTQARMGKPWWFDKKYDPLWRNTSRVTHWNAAKSDVWKYLKENTDIKIIHLKRNNILKSLLSANNAWSSGRWGIGATGGFQNSDSTKIELNFEETRLSFETRKRYEDEADNLFKNHTIFQIKYEDMLDTKEVTLRKLQEFLELDYYELKTSTKKQSNKALDEIIINYSDLKNKFSGTPWIEYFDC